MHQAAPIDAKNVGTALVRVTPYSENSWGVRVELPLGINFTDLMSKKKFAAMRNL